MDRRRLSVADAGRYLRNDEAVRPALLARPTAHGRRARVFPAVASAMRRRSRRAGVRFIQVRRTTEHVRHLSSPTS